MTTNVDIASAPHVPTVAGDQPTALETGRSDRAASRRWQAAPVLAAAVLAVAYVALAPRTADMAASVFRARLFGEAGFTIWNGSWYSGHPTWSYSVLVPPLAWLLGPALLGGLSAVASAALFEPLARRHFGPRAARVGALWFGVGALTPALSGRITFAVGVAAGLGALLAVQRGRPAVGCALALATGLASPIAGLFLALAGAAYALSGTRFGGGGEATSSRSSLRAGAALTAAAVAPPALVSLVFPDGREGPFVLSAFWPVPLFALAFFAALPARERALRIGALLYAAGAAAAYLVTTPMGGNAVRLGALVGGPLLACAAMSRPRALGAARRAALIALLVAFSGWQWSAAVRDVAHASGDRSTHASFYRPLLGFLGRAGGGEPFRVEIPFTFGHWETAEVAPRFALARGWLRPDDVDYNHLFYGGALTAATYRAWLSEHGVRFVAVPRAKPDYSARAELRLIASRPAYLRPVWRSRDWQVYEVTAPHPLVVPEGAARARLMRLGVDDADLVFTRPGAAVVRVRWTPFWGAAGACVERAGEWTRVTARRAGPVRLAAGLSLDRVLDHGRRCG